MINNFIENQEKIIESKLEKLKSIISQRESSIYDTNTIIENLINYFDNHFSEEHTFLKSYLSNEKVVDHENKKREFISKLKFLKEKDHVSIDVYIELKNWMTKHLHKIDCDLAESVKNIESSKCIVIVDDDTDDQILIKEALVRSGYPQNLVQHADSADILFNSFFKDKAIKDLPKLVILDMNLPRMNGIEILRKMKSQENLKNIPVIVLTGSTNLTDVEVAKKEGAIDFINKPTTFIDFQKVSKKIMSYSSIIYQPSL